MDALQLLGPSIHENFRVGSRLTGSTRPAFTPRSQLACSSAPDDELTSKGVTFERYDPRTDEKRHRTVVDTKVAWLRDPDGLIQG